MHRTCTWGSQEESVCMGNQEYTLRKNSDVIPKTRPVVTKKKMIN